MKFIIFLIIMANPHVFEGSDKEYVGFAYTRTDGGGLTKAQCERVRPVATQGAVEQMRVHSEAMGRPDPIKGYKSYCMTKREVAQMRAGLFQRKRIMLTHFMERKYRKGYTVMQGYFIRLLPK